MILNSGIGGRPINILEALRSGANFLLSSMMISSALTFLSFQSSSPINIAAAFSLSELVKRSNPIIAIGSLTPLVFKTSWLM